MGSTDKLRLAMGELIRKVRTARVKKLRKPVVEEKVEEKNPDGAADLAALEAMLQEG